MCIFVCVFPKRFINNYNLTSLCWFYKTHRKPTTSSVSATKYLKKSNICDHTFILKSKMLFAWVLDMNVHHCNDCCFYSLFFFFCRHVCVFPSVWWKLFLGAAVSVRHSLCESILWGQQDCVFDDEDQVASWNYSVLWVYRTHWRTLLLKGQCTIFMQVLQYIIIVITKVSVMLHSDWSVSTFPNNVVFVFLFLNSRVDKTIIFNGVFYWSAKNCL